MKKLTFYHQVRADGGKRTGIESDDETLLHHFAPGGKDHDPALLWYVDFRCEGERLPDTPDGARDWFVRNEGYFVSQLREVASDDLSVGFDAELMPLERHLADAPDGARVNVVVSAARRLPARDIAPRLRELADHWGELLSELCTLSPV